jgi:Ankyrin repeats (3 copies)
MDGEILMRINFVLNKLLTYDVSDTEKEEAIAMASLPQYAPKKSTGRTKSKKRNKHVSITITEKLRIIAAYETVATIDADNDTKLKIVLAYFGIFTELPYQPEYDQIDTVIDKAIFWLNAIDVSPTVNEFSMYDVAYVYLHFGMVINENVKAEEEVKICFHKAYNLYIRVIPNLPNERSDDEESRRILEGLQYMLDHLDDSLEALAFTDRNGNTLLHWIGIWGDEYKDVAKVCKKLGVNINRKNNLGLTALHLASENGHYGTVRFFIRYGANTEAMNDGGMTALHYAVAFGRVNVVKILVTRRHIIESTDYIKGCTCFMLYQEKCPFCRGGDLMTAIQVIVGLGLSGIVYDLMRKLDLCPKRVSQQHDANKV